MYSYYQRFTKPLHNRYWDSYLQWVYNSRSAFNMHINYNRTNNDALPLKKRGDIVWNSLSFDLIDSKSYRTFKNSLKIYIQNQSNFLLVLETVVTCAASIIQLYGNSIAKIIYILILMACVIIYYFRNRKHFLLLSKRPCFRMPLWGRVASNVAFCRYFRRVVIFRTNSPSS